jgi:hypothetical protein
MARGSIKSGAAITYDVGANAILPTGVSLYLNNSVTICGKICQLTFGFKFESNVASAIAINNYLPIEAYPIKETTITAQSGLGDGKSPDIVIRTNGAIRIYNVNSGNTSYAIGSVTYILA